jgi:metallo-beta-lactamase class B
MIHFDSLALMKKLGIYCLIFVLSMGGCIAQELVYQSKTIEITRISESTFLHVSYLQTDDFGKVGCNGLLVVDRGEGFVIDTPVDPESAAELLDWVETVKKAKVVGVLATHFHNDCLGGLEAFHLRSIPSYASETTIQLAALANSELPRNGFTGEKGFRVGGKELQAAFLGEGHTRDNIVCLVKEEKVLFGGCLVKEQGASKGFLGDANVEKWSETIEKVKHRFPKNNWVIPGHGKPGGDELLDYTARLFGKGF